MLKVKTHGIIARMNEIVEEKIYVAVGKEVNESKATLTWTLHNSGGKRVCILHVHQPAQRIPLMGTKFSADQLQDHQVRAYREKEKQEMNKILNDYTMICERAGARADVLSIEMDSIEKGIVDLISHHNIRKLVMGAAADRSYSKKMLEPKSKKAIYVRLQAPVSCQIMFICKGNLVHTREGRSQEIIPVINQATPVREFEEATRSQSSKEAYVDRLKLNSLEAEFRRVKSNIDHMKVSAFTPSTSRVASPHTRPYSLGSYSGWEGGSITSPSVFSRFSSCSSNDFIDEIASTSAIRTLNGLELLAVDCPNDAYQHTSPPSMPERGLNDGLYDQLKQAYADAEISKREAFEESMRRSKAEKNAIDAFRKVKIAEALCTEEVRQRKESEEALNRAKDNFENMKQQLEEVMEKLRISLEQKSSLENQIANSDRMLQELQQKMTSAVELLHKYKKERDELQVERDNALKLAEELREKQAEDASNTFVPQCFSEFSFSEIEEATDNFDLSTKIGEGGYGSIYKGLLRHTEVAIKKLHFNSSQGPTEYQQEVNILTKLRHPNLVTLIGACPEAWILVYEFYPNGSLEDRLSCKDNTPPLSWQTRIRIAAELCSALIFLHSCSPHSIVHGDLKPANILLDANFVSKLSDFGISRVLSSGEFTSNNSTPCRVTEPKGTLVYVDPEFFQTGELTVQSDVYSFGVILSRLLTGRPALGITKDMQCALEKGNLKKLLDPTAGEWPFIQAKQLAHLAMRCCEMNRKARPDLVSEVWRVLEPMRVSCSSFGMGAEGNRRVPPYFTCPIFQNDVSPIGEAALHDAPTTVLTSGETGGDYPPIDNFEDAKHVLIYESAKLWVIAGPIAFNILCNYGVNSFTNIFVGHIGNVELSAVAISLSVLSNFSFGFLLGMGSALETLCGQAFGAGQLDMLGVYMQRSWIILTTTCFFILPLYIYSTPILKLLGQRDDIAELAGKFSIQVIPQMFSLAINFPTQKFLQAQSKVGVLAWIGFVALLIHIAMSYLFIEVFRWGTMGAAVAFDVSAWGVALAQVAYIVGWCKEGWKGVSVLAFKELWPFVKLSVASAVMICLEIWYFMSIIVLTGHLDDPIIAVGSLSICMNINGWEGMLFIGINAAISVRVSNELGSKHPRAAKYSVFVTVAQSLCLGIICSVVIMLTRNQFSVIFTSDKEMQKAVSHLAGLLAITMLLNSVQPVISGVAVGGGWQALVAYINLFCYYIIGLPLGFLLGYKTNLGVEGIWIGMICGTFLQTLILLFITWKTNWNDEVAQASERLRKWSGQEMDSDLL